VRRREFIAGLGGAAAWPLVARAQKSGSVRRVGVLMSTASDDSLGQAYSAAFAQGLQQLGWEIGSNIRIDYRWGSGDTERFRKYAAELVGLSPDVILGTAASIVRAEPGRSHRIRDHNRSGRQRIGGESLAPGRQRHRFHRF
jgi:putative tryptophan/tyrosine transport system substrate-binding protein